MGLIRVAHVVKTHRLKREEEQRARIEAEQKRLLEERRRQAEQKRRDYLLQEATAWGQAQQVRAYIATLREKVIARHGEIQPDSQVHQWITWASRQADILDPLEGIGA